MSTVIQIANAAILLIVIFGFVFILFSIKNMMKSVKSIASHVESIDRKLKG
jgi:hypothetical protein